MLRTYRWLWGAGLLVAAIAVAFAVYSCGNSSKSTNPCGGGVGGGVGTKELNSGNIASGTSFAHVSATPGSFSYHCAIHAGMTGTVVVNAGGSTMDTTFSMLTGSPYPTIVCKTGGT